MRNLNKVPRKDIMTLYSQDERIQKSTDKLAEIWSRAPRRPGRVVGLGLVDDDDARVEDVAVVERGEARRDGGVEEAAVLPDEVARAVRERVARDALRVAQAVEDAGAGHA